MKDISSEHLKQLKTQLKGELLYDELSKALYATDASVYRILPLAVAFPKNVDDIKALIAFCTLHQIGLIPRTAGTSLAGQVVGSGIVVDVSKHFTNIIGLDLINKTVTVQPGVIRDQLNDFLKPHGLFFGPNTSTSNRCMIGGMVGNNSSGTTSIQYGVTRDKVLALETVLSDGSLVKFSELSSDEFEAKIARNNLEGNIYKEVLNILSDSKNIEEIQKHYPKPSIHRRNTGYALDALIDNVVFSTSQKPFNLCKLLAGSEGTLAFTTKITLKLDPLPPSYSRMVAAHFNSISEALKSVVPAMKHQLYTCEMMDKVILDCTKNNIEQRNNRFFIEGDPKAILLFEIRADNGAAVEQLTTEFCQMLAATQLPYAMPILKDEDIDKALELRKAGLGLLGSMVGDKKAVACIEDTAVALEDLSPYIDEFTDLMTTFKQEAVYYAHAGAGEIHLRPILNLKKEEGVQQFREITTQVAKLVKKYKGSMSGEHGDGIVRSEFIETMIGAKNYKLLRAVKTCFDPNGIFNPGKIIKPLPMDKNLRYETERQEPKVDTLMDFSDSQGILRAAEQCNGSGDCRKVEASGGTMCPSYRVTKNEKDNTRGRANVLREFLTQAQDSNPFDHPELKEVLDLCISCKGCKRECPSNVDMAALKAEVDYQYQKKNGFSLRNKFFAYSTSINKMGSRMPSVSNFLLRNSLTSKIIKNTLGIAPKRPLPTFSKRLKFKFKTLRNPIQKVFLFADEFVRYLDSNIVQDAISLLNRLNYEVILIDDLQSGRSFISKGFLEQAQGLVNQNIEYLSERISETTPLLGIEPSAVLSFRDEYLRLANDKEKAVKLSENVFLIEEFLATQIDLGHIKPSQFTSEFKNIKIHNHCHQKALSQQKITFDILNLPINYKPTLIASGCCGMAGSFGYEKEHYELSMKMAELSLFPSIKKADKNTLIAANGLSCRHQINDGTGIIAQHPISILYQALNK